MLKRKAAVLFPDAKGITEKKTAALAFICEPPLRSLSWSWGGSLYIGGCA